ncbi:ABC transporter permease [Alkalihalobacillus sp. LMS6]|uniref:ABC transporter permease n=1 Tax=Bacillaceae TaxID=186817 RepID=UPI000C07AF10|nr:MULTISPECIES: ABC transporter permease [Bacillaceae]UTR07596.1 ABC transporter permease [Alkalihalobacillus sp. LMS6]
MNDLFKTRLKAYHQLRKKQVGKVFLNSGVLLLVPLIMVGLFFLLHYLNHFASPVVQAFLLSLLYALFGLKSRLTTLLTEPDTLYLSPHKKVVQTYFNQTFRYNVGVQAVHTSLFILFLSQIQNLSLLQLLYVALLLFLLSILHLSVIYLLTTLRSLNRVRVLARLWMLVMIFFLFMESMIFVLMMIATVAAYALFIYTFKRFEVHTWVAFIKMDTVSERYWQLFLSQFIQVPTNDRFVQNRFSILTILKRRSDSFQVDFLLKRAHRTQEQANLFQRVVILTIGLILFSPSIVFSIFVALLSIVINTKQLKSAVHLPKKYFSAHYPIDQTQLQFAYQSITRRAMMLQASTYGFILLFSRF